MKKTNFFRELLDPESKVSSKRFAALILLGMFALTTAASVFVDINEAASDLVIAEGIIGAGLLGVNVFETINRKNKQDVESK
jgi:hypothetical protein